jgi:hypothetical protein
MPAEAGIQHYLYWFPAFAGKTSRIYIKLFIKPFNAITPFVEDTLQGTPLRG